MNAYESVLLRILEARLLDPPGRLEDPDVQRAALKLLRAGYKAGSRSRQSRLRNATNFKGVPPGDVPDWLVELLGRTLGLAGLHQWASRHHPRYLAARGDRGTLASWLHAAPIELTEDELAAGRRAGLGLADDHDNQTIDARLGPYLRSTDMPEQFDFDPRALPVGVDPKDLESTRREQVTRALGAAATAPVLTFVLGGLSLDGRLLEGDQPTLLDSIRKLRNETEGHTDSIARDPATGHPVPLANTEALAKIRRAFDKVREGGGPSYYEEFAFVARALIGNARNVPVDSAGLDERVAQQLAMYVPGQFGGTLSLPAFESPAVAGADMVASNIRAVAMVYAAWNLEELKLFQVLDRVIEVFMNGQLPVGFDAGGQALSEYYFSDAEQKVTEAARRMTYSRVLGVAGGQVSKEAPPNRSFQDLFLRFLSSVSEFDRQRRIADVVATGRPFDSLSLTAEQVRKSGRDLAANTTLYGYGGTHFVAQKLMNQITRAVTILNTPEILSAYGVQSVFQVVERVVASDLGGSVPNILQRKTMAETGKTILDIVADNIPAWLGSGDRPLFEPRAGDVGGVGPVLATSETQPDIDRGTEQKMMRNVEHWLAVNGIKDEQRARLGEPEVMPAMPSIPSATDGASGPAFDQLRQMVTSGQTPSLDQLKALLPDMGAVRV